MTTASVEKKRTIIFTWQHIIQLVVVLVPMTLWGFKVSNDYAVQKNEVEHLKQQYKSLNEEFHDFRKEYREDMKDANNKLDQLLYNFGAKAPQTK